MSLRERFNIFMEEGFSGSRQLLEIRNELTGHEHYGEDAQRLLNRLESNEPLQEALKGAFGSEDGSRLELAQQLQDMAEQNPDMFRQLNNVISDPQGEGIRPGAMELLDNMNEQPALQELIVGGASGEMSPAALAAIPAQLDNLVTHNPQVFEQINHLVMDPQGEGIRPGVMELLDNTNEQPALREMLMGSAAEGEMDLEALATVPGRLGALADHDPEVFSKLNDIVTADGFNELTGHIADNDKFRKSFQEMFNGGGDDPAAAADRIGEYHQQLQDDPAMFRKMNNFAENSPWLFNTFGPMMMDGGMGSNVAGNIMEGVQELGMFWGIVEAILPEGMVNMVKGFVDRLDGALSERGYDMGLGNLIAGDGSLARQVQGSQQDQTHDTELERQRQLGQNAMTPTGAGFI